MFLNRIDFLFPPWALRNPKFGNTFLSCPFYNDLVILNNFPNDGSIALLLKRSARHMGVWDVWIFGLNGSVCTEFATISLIWNLKDDISWTSENYQPWISTIMCFSPVNSDLKKFELKMAWWLWDQWSGYKVQWWHLHVGGGQVRMIGCTVIKAPTQRNPLLMGRRKKHSTPIKKRPKPNHSNKHNFKRLFLWAKCSEVCLSVTPFCEPYSWGRQRFCIYFGTR